MVSGILFFAFLLCFVSMVESLNLSESQLLIEKINILFLPPLSIKKSKFHPNRSCRRDHRT